MPYGVTEQLLESYAAIIFELSLNKQVRRGDPIRHLDVEGWRAEREATGLSDTEIAARVGLAVPQVTHIRNIVERRLFRTNQYRKLYRLGGGKRYRPGEYVDPEQALDISPQAETLRRALAFDPKCVSRYIRHGLWTSETLVDLIEKHANEQPEKPALSNGKMSYTWLGLAETISDVATRLATLNIGRGEVISIDLLDNHSSIVNALGAIKNGNVVMPLQTGMSQSLTRILERIAQSRASIEGDCSTDFAVTMRETSVVDNTGKQPDFVAEILKTELNQVPDRTTHTQGIAAYGVAAGDMAMLLPTDDEESSLVAHTHHTLLANARALDVTVSGAHPNSITSSISTNPTGFAVLLPLWLHLGIPLFTAQLEQAIHTNTLEIRIAENSDVWGGNPIMFLSGEANHSKAGVHVFAHADTLAYLFREVNAPEDVHWSPLSNVEIQSIGETIEVRGPSTTPGRIRDHDEASDLTGRKGWVKTRLAGSLDPKGRVHIKN